MRRFSYALAIVAALGSAGCGITDSSSTRTVEVAAHKAICAGPFFRFCLQIRDVGTQEWTFAYVTPQGFDFEWGVRQRIVIEETTIDNPPPDGSSIRRTLVRVDSRETLPVDRSFTLVVPGGSTSESAPGLHQFHFGSEQFACGGALDCGALTQALAGNDAVELSLTLTTMPNGPFELAAWRACGRMWPDCDP